MAAADGLPRLADHGGRRLRPASRDICAKFQREKGLTPDGIVGAQTWDATWSAPVTP